MKCSIPFLIFVMSAMPLVGDEVYIYQYDKAGNCIGRVLSTSTTSLMPQSAHSDALVEVYPLETDREFYIKLDSSVGENNTFYMSNLDGTRTYHGDILEDITTVDISSFKSGIYTLGVIYNNNLYSFKIIKK